MTDRKFIRGFSAAATVTLQIFLTGTANAAAAALEVIPVVTWQGIPLTQYQIDSVAHVRSELSQLNFAHFINPVYLLRGSEQSAAIRSALAAVLKESDAVGLHIAPIRDWSLYSKVKPGSGKNLYGQTQEACDNLCGLDQEMAGLSHKDIGAMLGTAVEEFDDAGLGTPKLAIFEEGLVPRDVWSIAGEFGIKEDWSGFRLAVTKSILEKYPVFEHNERMATELGIDDTSEDAVNGRRFDFIRFGLVMDAVSAEDFQETMKAAADFAKLQKRTVSVPLFMTAHSLVHVQHLLITATERLKAAAATSGIDIVAWDHSSARTWDRTRLMKGITLKPEKIDQPLPKLDLVERPSTEPEKTLESRLLNELPVMEEVPAEQPVFPSHAREMSH